MTQALRPIVKISPRGSSRLKAGHAWVYRSDIVTANDAEPGSVVTVTDHRGKAIGTAFYSSTSQIAIRMLSAEPVADLAALLRQRIAAALAYRERVVRDTNSCRLIFSEADQIPGLIVDRYDDILSLQILTQAIDTEAVRQILLDELTARIRLRSSNASIPACANSKTFPRANPAFFRAGRPPPPFA
jgi:23S rRNA (cytosine1962-C5)-methyltransferase